MIVFGPFFADYRDQIELAGGAAVEVVTRAEDGYAPRRDALVAAITPRTRAMIVNTPANPTGAAYDLPTLTMLAEVAEERDLRAHTVSFEPEPG